MLTSSVFSTFTLYSNPKCKFSARPPTNGEHALQMVTVAVVKVMEVMGMVTAAVMMIQVLETMRYKTVLTAKS
jgi:hypothetical protein